MKINELHKIGKNKINRQMDRGPWIEWYMGTAASDAYCTVRV